MENSNFYIYDASAGSGKTFTITKEYLKILLTQNQSFAFQNILAVTFTNKAAAEMKQRIVEALKYFSRIDRTKNNKSLFEKVCEETTLSPGEVEQKSLQVLKYLIPNYAGFEVSTIDSFNHRIIRTFAKDLKISQNFEVELDHKQFIKKAIEKLIDEVGKNEELTSWLVEFVEYKIDNNRSGDIQKDLIDYAELLVNEKNFEAIEKIQNIELKDLKRIKFKIIEYRKSLKEELKNIAQLFFELIEQHNIDAGDFKGNYISKYFKNIIQNDRILSEFSSQWHDIANTELYNKTAKETLKLSIDAIRPEIESLFLQSKSKSLEYHLSDRVLKNFVPLAMIREVQSHLNSIKEENEILFVNDFNRIISKQINNQPVPYIYERLGEKFRHYFIDEFQDTSTLQWKNLIPLVENAITTQHSDGSSGSLFLVGDVKQSIYEWRGGDPKQFLDLSQLRKNPFSVKANRSVLGDNWRSCKEIVTFNNEFFKFASKKLTSPDHRELYENVLQNEKKSGGYVEINFLPDIKNKDEKLAHQVSILQDIIQDQLENGFSLNEICILVRKNKEGVKISEAFNNLENPIPVISQESLLINSDAKVQLLVTFLKFVHDPNEETFINFILLWSSFNDLDYDYNDLKDTKGQKLEKIIAFLQDKGLKINLDNYRNISLYDKIEYALRVLNISQKANAYVQFFLDEVFEFSKSIAADINGFLDYWDEKKDSKSITTSEDADAVKIMTIHKSKGLEFPVVILANSNGFLADLNHSQDWINLDESIYGIPFFYSSISNKISNLSEQTEKVYLKNINKEELSSMNTAYVAMTRPVEHLYILSQPITYRKDYSFEDLLKDFLKEKAIYDDEKIKYTFGEKAVKKGTHKTYKQDYSGFLSFDIQSYYDTLTANETLTKSENDEQIYGKKVHDILQNVMFSEDFDRLESDEDTLLKVREILNHPKLSEFFEKDWSIYNEMDLVYNGQIFRPDRVCLKGSEAVIIDYKTGIEKESHFHQLTRYKVALEAMGFSIKSAFLVYIRKNIYIKEL